MARLAATEGLTEVQQEILSTVKDFVDKEIIPYATDLEHKDEFPEAIVEGMKEMGLFGLMIPEEHGGLGESLLTYALVVEQIARGWMSVSASSTPTSSSRTCSCTTARQEQKERLLR
jgi:alkylation response protein AidB-like acyl-CoA dehydrogenase